MTSGEEFLRVTLPALDRVHALALRLVRGRHDAEDLVQDTYLRAWQAWGRGSRPDDPAKWLSTICLNLARDRARSASVRNEVLWPGPLDVVDDVDTATRAVANVRRGQVHRALWRLSEEHRVTITLMDLLGFTASEVAELTRTPRSTVLTRVHRGRKQLARMVGSEVDHERP